MFNSCFQQNRVTGINAEAVQARFEREYAKQAGLGLSAEDAVNAAVKAINLDALQSLKNDVYRKVKNAAAFTRGQAETSTPLPGTGLLNQEPTRNGTLQRLMVSFSDIKGNVESVSQRQKGILGTYAPRMNDILTILGTKRWGLAEHRENYVMFEKALRGEKVDNPEIAKAAEHWKALNDEILDRAQAAGSVIGKRENWYRPQSWSRDLALSYGAGKGQAKYDSAHKNLSDAWFNNRDIDTYAREGIVGDAPIRAHIDEAAHSVLSDGVNKTETDTPNVRTPVSSRMAQERQIHIKTAEGAAELNRLFGAKSLPELLQDHVQSMAKNIALMERFGPDAQTTIQKLINHNIEQAPEGPAKELEAKAGKDAQNYADYFGHFNSDTYYTPAGKFIAGLKNLELLKLGKSAVYSLTTDQSTARVAQAAFGASGWEYTLHQLRGSIFSLKKAEQEFLLNQAGLAAHVMNQSIMRSWDQVKAQGWTKAVSSTFMKATHLRQIGEWNKESDRATLLSAVGKKVQNYQNLKDIKGLDGKILRSHGFTEADWQVMKLATPEVWGPSNHVLTAKAIHDIPDAQLTKYGDPQSVKRSLGEKLIGFAHEFDDTVIVEPGDKQRADIQGALARVQRGSGFGEIAHSMKQFKTFPMAFMARHVRMAQGAGPIAGSAYMASLLAANTVMGMVAGSIQDLLAGRNIRDWTETTELAGVTVPKHLGEAFTKGGGLGMVSDMIGSLGETDALKGFLKFAVGPVVAEAGQALASAWKPMVKLNDPNYDSKDFAGDFLRQGAGLTPTSLPFVSLIFQRELINQLQEWSNPGYNARSQMRSQKQYGTNYWWNPGETSLESAPDLSTAYGGQ